MAPDCLPAYRWSQKNGTDVRRLSAKQHAPTLQDGSTPGNGETRSTFGLFHALKPSDYLACCPRPRCRDLFSIVAFRPWAEVNL